MSADSPDRGGRPAPAAETCRPHGTRITAAYNAHTVATAIGLAVSGALYLAIPGALAAASVGLLSPSVAPFWATALIVGGIVAFVGVCFGMPRVEIVGLGFLGAAMFLATSAVLDVREETAIPAGAVYLTHGINSLARMAALVHLEATRDRVAAEAKQAVSGR